MNNKVITTQGNVQFQFPDGKIVNVHPNHIYTVFNEDTVSFILVGLPKTSGLSTMTSKAEDLELNGTVYSFAELPNAVSEAFAIAGAQARCEIVDELPESGYTNTIYLVPQEEGEGYDEYIWLKDEERWELIGNTDIEMKNYLKKVDFNAYSAATKVDIDNEISARTAGDTALDNKIDALSASTDEAISGLTDAIDAEETAREAADGVISGAVDTVSSGLKEEIQRAQNAESGLSDAIDAEEARAIAAENEKTVTISLTQAEYDLLPSSAKTDATKLYVISDAQPIDLSVYAKASALTEEISARTDADTALDNKIGVVSGAVDTKLAINDFNTYSAATDSRISEDEEVTAAAFNELNEALSGKQDVLEAGENITISGNVISAEGGGKAIEAGRGISVTTGETADTISFNLPITAGTGIYSIIEGNAMRANGYAAHAEGYSTNANGQSSHAEGYYTTASVFYSHAEGERTIASGQSSHAEGGSTLANGMYSHAEGENTVASGSHSHAEGNNTIASGTYTHAEGYNTKAQNNAEHASGQYNVSRKASTTFGDSGNTLFSVGNGGYDSELGQIVRHNAFEIRQNGDIYIADVNDTSTSNYYKKPMIKLQDALGGISSGDVETMISAATSGYTARFEEDEEVTAAAINNLNDKFGGLKLQQITQSAYDQLQTKDPSTLYVIVG